MKLYYEIRYIDIANFGYYEQNILKIILVLL
jgi:hypothetical protein